MQRITVTHDLDCTTERFWKLYWDEDYTRAQLLEGLGFGQAEFLAFDETEQEIHRRMRITPRLIVPAAVERVIGPALAMEERGRFDKTSQTFHWRQVLAVLPEKLVPSGTVRVDPLGDARCRRTSDLQFEAKIFGVGKLIEDIAVKNMRRGFDEAAEFMNRWLAKHPA